MEWYQQLPEFQRDRVRRKGFDTFPDLGSTPLHYGLLYSVAERWNPETSTLMIHARELSITLEDVVMIAALPIKGLAVIDNLLPSYNNMVLETLGTIPVGQFHGSLLLSWIHETFSMRFSQQPGEAVD